MKIKSIAAIILTGLLAVSMPMVAMAEDHGNTDYTSEQTYSSGTHTNIGSITYYDGIALDASGGSNVQVNRDVTGRKAVNASGKNTYVQIDGNANGAKYNSQNSYQGVNAEDSAGVHVAKNVTSVNSSGVRALTNAVVYVGGDAISGVEVGAWVESGASVTVSGNAIGKIAGVNATGTGTTVNVNGAVINYENGNAIKAESSAKVTAGSATNNTDVGNKYTVYADNNAEVVVEGDVTNEGKGVAICAENGAKVTAGSATNGVKDMPSGQTMTAGAGSTVTINGDVTNNGKNSNAISIHKDPTVTVFGEVNATQGIIFVGDSYSTDNYEVNVYKINADKGKMLEALTSTGEIIDVSDNANVIKNVHYIIKNSTPQYTFTLSAGSGTVGEVVDSNGVKYKTATAANDYKVTVATVSGYQFKKFAGDSASLLTDNGDGTYTLVVPAGGGVDLELVYEAIRRSNGGGNSTTTTVTTTNTGTGSWDRPATGTWTLNADGTWVFGNNGNKKFVNTWGYICDPYSKTRPADWYYFDENGIMKTGLQNINGKLYYFNEKHDGFYGAMLTGWQFLNGEWYYFSKTRDSFGGEMLVNTTTPDGYNVGANGTWIQ